MEKQVSTETDIIVSGLEVISPFGLGMAALSQGILNRVRTQTQQHRMKSYCDFPLCPIPQSDDLKVSNPQCVDSMNLAMLRLLIERVLSKTAVCDRYPSERIGIILGSTTFGTSALLSSIEQGILPSGDDSTYAISKPLQQVSDEYQLNGPRMIVSNACSSSASAIGLGEQLIASGMIDSCLVGGIDALSPVTVLGFRSLQILSSSLCRPFEEERDGINIGEGGGLLLLEKSHNAQTRLGRIKGYASNCDGYHMTQPDPKGTNIEKCMIKALEQAGIDPEQIGYINAHGTGTPANDAVEEAMIRRIFGNATFFESTKRFTGHILAGAGVIETAICLHFLENRSMWAEKLNRPDFLKSEYALSNSFGFGGNNTSIVVGL